jgi:hypothetical protein
LQLCNTPRSVVPECEVNPLMVLAVDAMACLA